MNGSHYKARGGMKVEQADCWQLYPELSAVEADMPCAIAADL